MQPKIKLTFFKKALGRAPGTEKGQHTSGVNQPRNQAVLNSWAQGRLTRQIQIPALEQSPLTRVPLIQAGVHTREGHYRILQALLVLLGTGQRMLLGEGGLPPQPPLTQLVYSFYTYSFGCASHPHPAGY